MVSGKGFLAHTNVATPYFFKCLIGERYLSLCSLLLFLKYYVYYFFSLIVLHQRKKITGDIMDDIPCDCIVHATVYGDI